MFSRRLSFVLLATVFILTGCAASGNSGLSASGALALMTQWDKNPPSAEDCSKVPDSIQPGATTNIKDLCYEDAATKENSFTLCDSIKDATVKNHCFNTIANTSNDPSDCNKLTDVGDLNDCLQSKAESAHDPALCDKVDFSNTVYAARKYTENPTQLLADCYWQSIQDTKNVELYKKYCPAISAASDFLKGQCDGFLKSHK